MGINTLWSNSLSSVHRFQTVIPNKDNYENMYDSENQASTNGFNTLPSLKKKNQTRISEVFQNEPFTAYFFSSAENLGCSTSNIGPQSPSQNDSFPPRVFLTNDQPNTSRHGPSGGPSSESNSSKGRNEADLNESSVPSTTAYGCESRIRPVRSAERNTSLVKKLFVNCSPTKHKPKIPPESQTYSVEKKENLPPTPKKLLSKKLGEKESVLEGPDENVITFHYRVGIPKSPNVQNFSKFAEKAMGSFHWKESGKSGSGNENWSSDRTSACENPQTEGHKLGKGVKYLVKDIELLQKHNSLIKEFNETLDLHRHLKYKDNNKSESKKSTGIENGGFQEAEESSKEASKETKQHYSKNFHEGLENNSGNYSSQNQETRNLKTFYATNETDGNEDYMSGKTNENESDVYFGDISNSSCYEPESLLLEEGTEDGSNVPRFSSSGHPLLNKQNLKMIEVENLKYNEIPSGYDSQSDGKQHSENTNYKKHQNGYRHVRMNNQYCEQNTEGKSDEFCPPPQRPDAFGKNHRQSFMSGTHYPEATDNKVKYFFPVSGRGLQDSYLQSEHHHEYINSNDEQSSSSLTADSGISSGGSFVPKCFENAYHEIEYRLKEGESNRNIEGNKMNAFDTLGDFAHPLFQKPKVLPRENRYKESETIQTKKIEQEDSVLDDNDLSNQKPRNRTFGKIKNQETVEEVSNQLLNTCNLTLSTRFMSEEGHQFKNLSKDEMEEMSGQKENYEEGMRKSPKPLPRTSVLNKSVPDSNPRCSLKKEKANHFLAPDAQYEYQDNFKSESKCKAQMKHGEANATRSKPAISARPLHLQEDGKKSGKVEGLNLQILGRGNEAVRPLPRRRRNNLDASEGKEIEIGAHSVNV